VLIATAGARLAGAGSWFEPRVPFARGLFYLGMAAVSLAWLGLGRRPPSVGRLWLIAAAWCAPLLAGPVLFSHDVYSYLAQGQLLHLGLNPYHDPPAALGHSPFLEAVSPFWRHTTAPYGPLFLGAVRVIVSVTGPHLIAGVLLVRLLDVIGMAMVAAFVPRLARAVCADPARATWLAVLSPLVLLELIAAGHNDALMIGLLVAGVTLAVERRPLAAIVLCALATTVKLPAAAAVLMIAVTWAQRDCLLVLVRSALAAAAVALAVGAAAGTGLSWVSTSLVSTPHKVRLAITPSTGLGYTAAAILRDFGVHLSSRDLESALAVVGLGVIVVAGLWLTCRARTETLPRDLGLLLLIAAVCGPALWPWYLPWGLGLLAAWPGRGRTVAPGPPARRPVAALALPVVTIASVFVVKPDGILGLPLGSAPAVIAVYAALAALAGVVAIHRRERRSTRAAPEPARPPVLVESR
jgi:alpha-1,6-mannosyltransferase